MIIVAPGHGVITNPVVSSDKLSTERKRKGREIIVRFIAINELVDVRMLVE